MQKRDIPVMAKHFKQSWYNLYQCMHFHALRLEFQEFSDTNNGSAHVHNVCLYVAVEIAEIRLVRLTSMYKRGTHQQRS